MSAPVPNRTLPRAHPRAGSGNPARRVDRRSYASCVVSGHRKCRESQHQTRVTITRTAIGFDRGQQFSVTALTTGGGSIVERYAYSAYGEPTITDGAGAVQSVSSEGNRYLYTGREWDEALSLYHYRARMYDTMGGRFCGRDPIGYAGSRSLYRFNDNTPLNRTDPSGNVSCTSTGVAPGAWSVKGFVGGNWSVGFGGALNPLPANGTVVNTVTCAQARTVNYTYSCKCPCMVPVITSASQAQVATTTANVPGGVLILSAAGTFGPATGVAFLGVWLIGPALDRQKAANACAAAVLPLPPAAPPAPTVSYDCPGIPFY